MSGSLRGRVRIWISGIALAAAALLGGCSKEYSQDTPDAVVATAKKMIENGDAKRLTELVYADSKDMRRLLNQMGRTMGSLQDLASAVQKAYPKEIEKLKADAEEGREKGRGIELHSEDGRPGHGPGRRRPPPRRPARRQRNHPRDPARRSKQSR
jgi:hypothetical protein